MDVTVQRCAGIDIGKADVKVCIRVPAGSRRRSEVRTFSTMTGDLLALRDWLLAEQVTLVGMEATGSYWKPIFYLLERDIECWLLNARHMKAVPGRKTDVKDSEWIARLIEHGLVRPSFVPPRPIRELRDLTRYRTEVVRERTRQTQRLEKLLEDAGIKLSTVVSDMLGKSGRAMLEALIAGERDPRALAELALGRLRGKVDVLTEALTGFFGDHHAFLARAMLDRIDAATATEARLNTQIDKQIQPFRRRIELLATIPGLSRHTAEVVLAEIGADITRFPPQDISHPGPESAPATTSPPATAPPARPARAIPGSKPSSAKPRSLPPAANTPTSPPATGASCPAAAANEPSSHCSTRS